MIHVFAGTLMAGITLFYTFFAMRRLNFKINYNDWHHLLGLTVPIVMIVTALLGKLARDRMFLMQRNHREIIPMRVRHANLGYIIIVIS